MTPAVVWLRHGTCVDGLARPAVHARPTSPLSTHGADQVRDAARRLAVAGLRAQLIGSSPLLRASESAALLSRAWAVPVTPPENDFAEWRAPSCVLGFTPSEYPDVYRRWQARRSVDIASTLPGGESLQALAERAHRARERAWCLSEAAGTVVVVSHRVLVGCVAALAAGMTEPAAIFAHARGFGLDPGCWWVDSLRERGGDD